MELVDTLIGNSLAGNIYSDTQPYQSKILQTPPNQIARPSVPQASDFTISEQSANRANNLFPPTPSTQLGHFATVDSGIGSGQITDSARNTIYSNPSLSKVLDLASFHQNANQPPTPTFTANQNATNINFPIKSPIDAGPTQKVGSQVVNEFINSPNRPLNFRDPQNSPPREDLVAKPHPQHLSWNATGEGVTDARRGILTDNLYSPGDTPFQGNFLSVFEGPTPGYLKNYINVLATGHWLRNIATELGLPLEGTGISPRPEPFPNPERIIKGVSFLATQLLLTSFNSANPEYTAANAIWNPLSIAAAIPILGSAPAFNITLASIVGDTYERRVRILDDSGLSKILALRSGQHVELMPVHRLSKFQTPVPQPGFLGDVNSDRFDAQLSDKIPTVLSTIEGQVDGRGPTAQLAQLQGLHTNLYNSEQPYGPEFARISQKDLWTEENPQEFHLSTLFSPSRFPGDIRAGGFDKLSYNFTAKPLLTVVGFPPSLSPDDPGLNAAVVPAGYPTENELGLVETTPLNDADVYMPFMFEDLRDPNNEKRFLYFRAFLKDGLAEQFAPDWQASNYYGRVDAVPNYKSTSRTLNLAFDVAAFTVPDLSLIWKKLDKLQSMVYPAYDLRGFITASPIIRLRIGDLFAGKDKRGLPGYITSMDFSYPDGIWEIETDFKTPRFITVTMNYTVLHDGNPGIYEKTHYTLDQTGKEVVTSDQAPAERIFGAGTFETEAGAGSKNTKVTVSREEIRRIFQNVRNN